MSKTNCCNCGAALDIFAPKCEFCGTKNINMTEIDLASGEAANFIFKLPSNIKVEDKDGQMYMSILAVPELATIEITDDYTTATGGWGNSRIVQWTTSRNFNMNLNLRAVQRESDNTIMTLHYDK